MRDRPIEEILCAQYLFGGLISENGLCSRQYGVMEVK